MGFGLRATNRQGKQERPEGGIVGLYVGFVDVKKYIALHQP